MVRLIKKNKDLLIIFLFSLFFLSLIYTPNDINSKVIIAIGLFSLFFFNFSQLKRFIEQHYLLITFFLLICISLLYTENINMGLKKMLRASIIPISLLIFSSLDFTKKTIQTLLWIFVLTVLLVTLYSHGLTIVNFINNEETNFRNFFNLNYSYLSLAKTVGLHPTYYAYYILTAIIILLLAFRVHGLYMKIAILFLIAYFSFFIVHLSSRISIIILYIIIMYNLIHYVLRYRKIFKSLLLILIFHLLIIFVILNVGVTKYRFQHIFGFTYYTGYTVNDGNHKIKLWTAALSANDNFMLGNGIGDIDSSLKGEYQKYELYKPLKENYNSHNQYIEYFVGLGLVGSAVFCFLLIYYAKKFFVRGNQIGFQFIIITALFCLTECIWNRHHGIVFFVFMLGLLWASKKTLPMSKEPKPYRPY